MGGSWQPFGAIFWDLGWSWGDLGVISGHFGTQLGVKNIDFLSAFVGFRENYDF